MNNDKLKNEFKLNAANDLFRAAGALNKFLSVRRAADGLTLPQYSVLQSLLRDGPLCQNELAEKLQVTGPNICRLVDVLERDGWVERVRSRQDRRYIMVTLTEEGHRRIAVVAPRHEDDLVEALSSMSPHDLERFGELCRIFAEGILSGSR